MLRQVTVSLSTSSSEVAVNSVDVPPPEVFYVIIGRGPAGVTNCTTLFGCAKGLERLDGRRVLQVGFKNPWPTYLKHGMGQPGYLLTLPGFAAQPNATGTEVDGGLDSREFGAAIDVQLAKLVTDNGVVERPGWVVWIQKKGADDTKPVEEDFTPEAGGPEIYAALGTAIEAANRENDWPDAAEYRVLVLVDDEPTILPYYASHIDFCSGPGRPNIFGGGDARDQGKTAPWLAPENWDDALKNRRVLNGVDAIVDEVALSNNERICVTAGGGVGLNCAEKSQKKGCWLDWFGRTTLVNTFDNPRNQTFLEHAERREAMAVGELNPALFAAAEEGDRLAALGEPYDTEKAKKEAYEAARDVERDKIPLYPTHIKLRYGKLASLDRVTTTDTHAVVKLKASKNGGPPPLLVDHNRVDNTLTGTTWECTAAYLEAAHNPEWPAEEYDRLFIPNGQSPNMLGQPRKYTTIEGLTTVDAAADGRMLGLQSGDGRIRLLGAAAQVYNGYAVGTWEPTSTAAKDKMWAYREGLPVSTVPDGLILSGVNIATANGYFDAHPNTNVNTMTKAELTAALPDRDTIVDAIVAKRNVSNGYRDYAELEAAVNQARHPTVLTLLDREAITAAIVYGYPAIE
ncbi:MAG: hypothetical protein ACRBN8_40110 [Nannocystales bacterium]